jgi:NAD(P)-dependent dehydrogenase (short-subunit alcohol dehydrogenase family)
MDLNGSVALVTGANRGLGRAFARALLERGASTVYAGARDPRTITDPRLTPVPLDITNSNDVAAAAQLARDVNLLINNAGVSTGRGSLVGAPSLDAVRADLETNVLGTLAVSKAFAPVLAANGGGAIVNMLSVLSFITVQGSGSYSVSKAAEWALTNALRLELHDQGTLVIAVHVGYVDTDLTAKIEAPKHAPDDVVAQVLDAVVEGRSEVLVDDLSRQVKAGLSGELGVLYPTVA